MSSQTRTLLGKRRRTQDTDDSANIDFFSFIRREIGYGKRERLRDVDKKTWIENALYLGSKNTVRGFSNPPVVFKVIWDEIIQKIEEYEKDEINPEGKRKDAKSIRKKLVKKLDEIAVSLEYCCSKDELYHESTTLECEGDDQCRIQPHSNYYQTKTSGKIYCEKHTDEKYKAELNTMKGKLKLLEKYGLKKFHDGVAPEKKVHCVLCEKDVHVICEQWNGLNDIPKCAYVCRACRTNTLPKILKKPLDVNQLEEVPSSKYLEKEIRYFLISNRLPANVFCRLLTCVKRDGTMCETDRESYPKLEKMVDDSPHVFKLYGFFNKIEEQDVIISMLAVNEYSLARCPATKRGLVGIQHFETVDYFKPKELTDDLNQTILRSYLRYVQLRKFHKVQIFARSPIRLDVDFLMNCRSPFKTMLNQDQLFGWYQKSIDDFILEWEAKGATASYQNKFVPGENATIKSLCEELYLEDGFWGEHLENFLSKPGSQINLRTFKRFIKKTTERFPKMQFYITLSNQQQPVDEDPDREFRTKIGLTPKSFIQFQTADNLQFNTLRRAKYTSKKILDYIFERERAFD